MAVNDPTTAPDLTGYLVAQLAPLAQQLVASQTSDLQQRLTSVEQQLADSVSATVTQLEPNVLQAGTAILTNIESDPTTQRIVVCAVIGAALLGALIILVSALLGNGTAARYIAAAPALLGGAVLWISKAGVSLPAKGAA